MSQEQQDLVEQQVLSLEDHASSSSTLDTPQPETSEGREESQSLQSETSEGREESQAPLVTSGKKGRKKKGRLVSVEEIMPKPSYWPLALAVSFVVLSMGIIISWIVIAIGAILMIASIMGWALERR
jgi:hypothetical protein